MVSILPLTSISSSSLSKPLSTVPNSPATICLPVTLMFDSFLSPLARFKYLAIISFSFLFFFFFFWFAIQWTSRDGKIRQTASSFLLLLLHIWSRLLAEIRWSACIWIYQRILRVSFYGTDSGFYIYHLVVWSDFYSLHIYQWITFPTLSFFV